LSRHFAEIKPANDPPNPAIHLDTNGDDLTLQWATKKHFDPVIINIFFA
jgi:hypothetical protein